MKMLLIIFPIMIMLVTAEPPRPVYGPPKASGSGGDEISEPANYEFAYEVKDDKDNLDFGHMESRQGDSAKGSYHVLLPDGRTQKVDYIADESGYMPKVVYDGKATYSTAGSGTSGGGGYRY